MGFCPLAKQNAAYITKAILSQLEKWGLEIENLRGQGYDVARTMSGHVNSVQQLIRELQPRALFTHCRSQALNLVVVHGCSENPLIRNTRLPLRMLQYFSLHLLLGRTCYKSNHKEARTHRQVTKEKQEASTHVQHTLGLQREDMCFSGSLQSSPFCPHRDRIRNIIKLQQG